MTDIGIKYICETVIVTELFVMLTLFIAFALREKNNGR